MDDHSVMNLLARDLLAMGDTGPQRAVELLAAAFAGGVLGYERELSRSPAGIKTCALVCVGATMYMQVGHVLTANGGGGDPTRMASQIVTGIGFLGAGTILRDGRSVSGLTSAATVWFTGAVGVVIGCGLPVTGILAGLGVALTMRLLAAVEGRLFPHRRGPSEATTASDSTS